MEDGIHETIERVADHRYTPDDGRDMTALFATADGRLYGAKEAGRNRVLGRRIERTEPEPGPAQMDPRTAKTA